ncbi:transcription elongation factor, mitochondrial isoform X1 [Bactrocera dorsalis]|uniref:Transcription elongation factor, mitochondrial isoform X1 n=1 Tax=Bactrocera dorsalis TaxID=27457 RepID=A0A6I9VLU1_BACDO|nr:transcription elongation factor, mitochondrial isoform X1 [Bactrocera dorsalis]
MFRYFLPQFVKQAIKNPNKSQIYAFSISKSTSANVDALLPQSLESNKQTTGKNPLQNYTKDQQDKILTIVNKNEELLNYDIAKTRAVKLIAWKKRNGPLQSLEDILQIEGFSLRIADKFYKSMLGGHVDESKVAPSARRRTAGFITPAIDAEHRAVLRSCVSLRVGVSSITWARLELPDSESINAPCNLTHWQHHDITEKKLHLSDLVQRLLYVDHLIPDADCYIFENPQMAINSNPGNVDQQNISIQKSQVTAVLAYALCTRGRYAEALKNGHEILPDANKKTEETWPNVFYLRRFLTARLFSQLVGTERVSSEETILQLMRTHYNVSQLIFDDESETVGNEKANDVSFRRNVQFPLAHRDMFSRAERYQREFLGQALLLNLAFMRLVVLQDADSIAVVTRNPNKTELEQLS